MSGSRSSLQSPEDRGGLAVQVMTYDMVIKIEKPSVRWELSFIDSDWIVDYTPNGFMPALTWYPLSEEDVGRLLSETQNRQLKIRPIPTRKKPVRSSPWYSSYPTRRIRKS